MGVWWKDSSGKARLGLAAGGVGPPRGPLDFLPSIDFRRRKAMQKLALVTALAAAIVVPIVLSASSAQAAGRLVWGDRDFEIIRWSYGDCKIWFDDNGPPWGDGWRVLADRLPTWDAALARLRWLQARGMCAPS
jgi:hypothetical protein